MRINERAQIFFYFLSHFLLTISKVNQTIKRVMIEYIPFESLVSE